MRLAMAGAVLCCGSAAMPVCAAEGEAEAELPPVVITGYRASATEAQRRRRAGIEPVDSIVATDIHKLPDVNVTEALQRIPGVQISRDRGEGASVALRGLTQVETLIDGREAFSAGTARVLDMTTLPAELVAGIDVYKTADASRPSGGLGGTVDVRTRRPFDFEHGRTFALTTRAVHGDLVDKTRGQFAGLYSERARTGAGEFGWLLHLVQQDRAWREDQRSIAQRLNATSGLPEVSGVSESLSVGLRRRRAGRAALQWAPHDRLELYAEATAAELRTRQDTYQVNALPSPGSTTSTTLFPGTQDVQSIAWTAPQVSILSFARDTVDRVWQGAVGGRWRGEATEVRADLSSTRAYNSLFFSGLTLGTTPDASQQVRVDLGGRPVATSITGVDLLDPNALRYTNLAYRWRPFKGQLDALRLDVERPTPLGPIERLSAGLRLASRRAGNERGLILGDAAIGGAVSAQPDLAAPNPYTGIFPGTSSIGGYLAGNVGSERDPEGLRGRFGVTAPIPESDNLLALWRIREDTTAGYVNAHFRAAEWPLDGTAGVRLVHTRVQVNGYQSVPADGSIAPLAQSTSDTRLLPAANLRWTLSPATQLRASASHTVTRPAFDQLSPSLTLIPNSIDPTQNRGTAGNPALKPIRSTNLDLAVDHAFSRSGVVSATLFRKRVDGFISTLSADEVYDGVTYRITRPQNARTAHINGLELGAQQFLDFLPAPWRGLGWQATYTFVDGEAPLTATGAPQRLQELSRHSANLVALYEQRTVSARVAYNWRSRFVTGYTSGVGARANEVIPTYTAGYGWLDAALNFRLNDRLTLGFEASNLLRTRRWSYFGVETRPQNEWLNDRQLALTLALKL